jgi:hypothetical protein
MMRIAHLHLAIAIAILAVILAACSREQPAAAPSAGKSASVAEALSPYAVEQARRNAEAEARANAEKARVATLPQPDPATPDSTYAPITSGSQLLFLYAANSGMPPDYERLAAEFSQEYRSTQDNFRKRDLIEALKPKIDAKIAEAKATPYLIWTDSSPNLGHYDFGRKGFPVNTPLLHDGGYGYISDYTGGGYGPYQLGFSNSEPFRFVPVADETRAKEIEGLLGQYGKLALKIRAFAQSTDENHRAVLARIVNIQLLGPNEQVLAEVVAP